MKRLSESSSMKKVCLPPSSQPWRYCPRKQSNSKRVCPIPHLYRPISQLLGASISLLEREDAEGTHHKCVRAQSKVCINGL